MTFFWKKSQTFMEERIQSHIIDNNFVKWEINWNGLVLQALVIKS